MQLGGGWWRVFGQWASRATGLEKCTTTTTTTIDDKTQHISNLSDDDFFRGLSSINEQQV